ncbi:MAG: polysaccharide pyruvyl transferase CsaB [Desulfurispora sp.]|uniref:polysaccharide pyruvyl transferase CsaB n=1 Tax=Desulfurispora sp. TaxID=3014275 RepID=UPI00404A018C
MPRVVISGYYGFHNNGDEAMLYAILQALGQRVPGLEAVVLSKDPEHTRAFFGVQAVPRHDLASLWRELGRSDMLISGGGGLLQDVTGPNSVIYYLGVVQMARLLGRPVVFYGHGIGPVRTALGRGLMRLVVNQVDLVTVRDEASRQELAALGVRRPPVHVTADPVLGLDGLDELKAQSGLLRQKYGLLGGAPLVGISVRHWQKESRYKAVLAVLADRLVEQGLRVVFLPMHHPGDVTAAREVRAQMQQPAALIEQRLDFKEMMALISGLHLAIGMRLHFLIFGALLGVPVLGLSYDPKVDRFLQLVDMPLGGRIEHLQLPALWEATQELLSRREERRRRMAERVRQLRSRALAGADLVAGLLRCER